MFISLKELGKGLIFLSMLLLASAFAANESQAATNVPPSGKIKIIGKSMDGKYPIYDLYGELEDMKWRSAGKLYKSDYLFDHLVFIDQADVGKPYSCGIICKDGFQNVVGLNPAYKFLARPAKK